MLEAKPVPSRTAESFWRPERKAWAVMLSAFVIFCALASTSGFAAYRFAFGTKPWSVTAQVAQSSASSAFLKRAGFQRAELLVDGTRLGVGDEVSVSPSGPAGIAARLLANGATVGLWPSTMMLIERNDRGALRLRLEAGQALIDLPNSSGTSLFVTASPLAQEFELTPPGRYRIRELSNDQDTMITAQAERSLVPGIEVATDTGLARMGENAIRSGERLVGQSSWRKNVNRWELVRDGDFRAHTVAEYWATLTNRPDIRQSDTWLFTQQGQSVGANPHSGLFYVLERCEDNTGQPQACRNVVRLARLGGNTKDSITAITEEIAADVAAYRHVTFEADVRIDYQSLSKGGADGSECPLFARVVYANDRQTDLEQNFCFWAFDKGTGAISSQPYIISSQIEPNKWHHFTTDLRTVLPNLRVVQRVIFYANGHDYDVSIADVSMWTEGLADALQQ